MDRQTGDGLLSYQEWLDELIADRDESGTPITRREYYQKFFNGADTLKIYEQDVAVTARLRERGAITED
ncbi:MAG: hypothetical protein F4245_01060 [Cenarchaeum sp. SB0678_bin_8]|nr:hypothetical protein [Cenarchaeum sp. SB0666_bin_15]MYB46801.1 hypothetical protein [Cenarchaeum sp. SB0662_bin_33]MYD58199.1 hypothetical protein [Cenarchaeum sp. SB0678_bin_8]